MTPVSNTYELNWWQRILYTMVYGVVYLLSLIPLRIHYFLSDIILYPILYKLLNYRVKVVRKNLSDSFPERSVAELRQIERDFYHWLCDYFVETIKLTSISEKEMRRRMTFEGTEEVRNTMQGGKSVSLYLGHYCNWEWISSLGVYLAPFKRGQIYHQLENEIADKFFLKIRGRFDVQSIVMEDTLQIIHGWAAEGHVSCVGYISDQVPGFSSMHYWPQFLHHKTPTYSGTERIARLLNTAVYYVDILRPKRGYYVARFVKMTDDPRSMPKFSITEQYYQLLEQSIQAHPAYWLWSHNRWKRTWEDFCQVYPDEKERNRILSKL